MQYNLQVLLMKENHYATFFRSISEYYINEIRRVIFDSIEDANNLSQEHRIWLLDTLESVTTTLFIRESLPDGNVVEELCEMRGRRFNRIVEKVFKTYIEL